MSTLQELENKWALMMAAVDPRTGERVADRDLKYRREAFALRVQIEERKAAEAKRVEVSPNQNAQIEWLNRLATARGENGRQLWFEHTPESHQLRVAIDGARAKLVDGKPLDSTEVEKLRKVAESTGATDYPGMGAGSGSRLLPPADFLPHPGAQPIHVNQGPRS